MNVLLFISLNLLIIIISVKPKKRNRRRNMSKEAKFQRKLTKEETDHDEFMNYYLDDNNPTMHPLAILTHSDYKRLKDNIIILHNPVEVDGKSLQRKIFYDIRSIGKNLKLLESENSIVVQLRQTKKRFFMIVIHKKEMKMMNRVSAIKYDHEINMTSSYRRKSQNYVILMICGDFSDKIGDNDDNITKENLSEIQYILPNQITKDKHFGSGGKVYSIGYSAKYNIQGGKSFQQFVTSKSIVLIYF